MFKPRAGQSEVLKYTSGLMGITAVPGSGKTHTLSYLAASLIASSVLQEDQEILIVTLTNSGVNNFSTRIAEFLTDFGLIPGVGYRVRTLHGLAYDIVREQPQLAALDNQFSIADERISNDILSSASLNWLRQHVDILQDLSADTVEFEKRRNDWNRLIHQMSGNAISFCKDMLIDPADLDDLAARTPHPLLTMLGSIYASYERALQDRGAVDFSDLISFAYTILSNNPAYLDELKKRWPFVLEDEAQDSSQTQEKLLALLSSQNNNWVRVGDPNQAIYETFTTADPKLLRQFVSLNHVNAIDLPHSGRSSQAIISLANHLIQWTKNDHPRTELRHALDEPFIKPAPIGDPQPNPEDLPGQVILYPKEYKPDEEIRVIARSAKKWIDENPNKTAAILIPRNARGSEMVNELTSIGAPTVELLNTPRSVRDTAVQLRDILRFFTSPLIRRNLAHVFASVANLIAPDKVEKEMIDALASRLSRITNPELLFTQPDGILKFTQATEFDNDQAEIVTAVFEKFNYWQGAILLPIDEMIITIGSDLFKDPADLALVHKIALILKRARDYYPEWQLNDFADELDAVASNRYRLSGFSEGEIGFDPDQHKGEIVVSTMHKAKGLEWDRVYLMSVNNYNFPSLSEQDTYISEKWFVKDQRNLQAELIEGIKSDLLGSRISSAQLIEQATQQARIEFCAERLRLLYVGITRARESLIITWNNGRRGNCTEALPLRVLREFWDKKNGG